MSFTHLITQLFGTKEKKGETDPALNQGASFLYMQNEIIKGVLPSLPLMDETTGAKLGSIVETLETETTSLQKVNNVEKKKIQTMEDKFNKTLSEYTKTYKSYADAQILANKSIFIPKCYTIPGQSTTYGCEKQTTETACNAIDPFRAGEESAPSFTKIGESSRCRWGDSIVTKKKPDNSQVVALKQHLLKLNEQLIAQTNLIWKEVQKINSTEQQLDTYMDKQRDILQTRMSTLEKTQSQLKHKNTVANTLSSKVQNKILDVDATYMHYIVWGIAAVTIGAISIQQLSK